MRDAVKDRLIITGLGLVALPVAICSVSWAHKTVEACLNVQSWTHMTLEACLNLLWVLLAVGAFAHWLRPDRSSDRRHLFELVTLVFVLLLLLPVVSAYDDLAQRDLIADAKTSHSVTAIFKNERHIPHSAGLLGRPMALAVQIASLHPATYDLISEPPRAKSVAAPGSATGNHSPPRR